MFLSLDSIRRVIWKLEFHRWAIPIAIGALGAGYTFWETVMEDHRSATSEQAVMGYLLLGVIGPLLAFATLTWAVQGARYWETANQELEKRVANRTLELERARAELADKALILSQMLAEERRIEEKTRSEIAGDLHDGVQQLIVGALYEIQSARDSALPNPQLSLARLESAQDLLRRIEAEMRGAIYSLHPIALDAQGLAPVLRECAARFERVSQAKCDLNIKGDLRRLAPEVEVATFRIVQEALNNVQAHARARRVSVELTFSTRTLTLIVDDDGMGFDTEGIQLHQRAHLGLIGMRERAANVGGTLGIESHSGAGTRVTLNVPLQQAVAPRSPALIG